MRDAELDGRRRADHFAVAVTYPRPTTPSTEKRHEHGVQADGRTRTGDPFITRLVPTQGSTAEWADQSRLNRRTSSGHPTTEPVGPGVCRVAVGSRLRRLSRGACATTRAHRPGIRIARSFLLPARRPYCADTARGGERRRTAAPDEDPSRSPEYAKLPANAPRLDAALVGGSQPGPSYHGSALPTELRGRASTQGSA